RLGWRALVAGVGLFVGGLAGLAFLLSAARSEPEPQALAAKAADASASPEAKESAAKAKRKPAAVVVHYSAYDPAGERAARRVASKLAAEGFDVRGVHPVRGRVASTTVRYFFESDRDAVAHAKRAAAAALRRSGAAAP